jgi:hypothetical protein
VLNAAYTNIPPALKASLSKKIQQLSIEAHAERISGMATEKHKENVKQGKKNNKKLLFNGKGTQFGNCSSPNAACSFHRSHSN